MSHARLLAIGAIHVDTPDLALAVAHVESFVAETGFELDRLCAEPYPKVGPHARVALLWRLPEGTPMEAVPAALDSFCASIAGPGHAAHRSAFHDAATTSDGPYIVDERILDARAAPFTRQEFVWLHVEIGTSPAAQADFGN